MFFGPLHTLTATRKFCVTTTTTNQTKPKKHKRSRTSFSGSKRGNTKASRKAAKAAAEPKTPSPSANTSKKRPRSNSPAKPSPSSAKKRTAPPPIPMAFLLAAADVIIRRAGKDLWWRVTPDSCGKDDTCVGSRQKWEDVLPAFIEADLLRSKSVGGGGKHELQQHNEEKWKEDMQQHLKEHCSLKLHLSTCRPRGKTRRRALCVCAHRLLRKKKEDNHPKFSGPEGQKVHEKRNPDEVLFSGRSAVSAAMLGERLSAHRKEVQSAHCEARVKSLRAISVVPRVNRWFSALQVWRDQLYKSLTDGISNPIGRKEVRGRKACTDMIEEKEPGCLSASCIGIATCRHAAVAICCRSSCVRVGSPHPHQSAREPRH